jgi:capsular polysaccharide export protein
LTHHTIVCPSGIADRDRGLPSSVFAYGFSFRKRSIVRRFAGNVTVRFIHRVKQLPPGSALLLWGSKPVPVGLAPGIRIVRLEDGFLRSVGLGADLIDPVSWVMDQRGIYYDATRPSDLECLLQATQFSSELIERASQLRGRIVETGLTKYNVGASGWRCPAAGARVILVPGQVETDASIQFGAPGICTNIGLLQAVRKANPDAYIVYKPHPDVVAGLRAKGQGEGAASHWCDEVVVDAAMGEMLSAVDELHVLTSLAGFEGLLRGKSVTCYGQPFYAGWGLTKDQIPVIRRTRCLSLNELVAGALILYPLYASRSMGQLTTPELALDELLDWRDSTKAELPWWHKILRAILRIRGSKR